MKNSLSVLKIFRETSMTSLFTLLYTSLFVPELSWSEPCRTAWWKQGFSWLYGETLIASAWNLKELSHRVYFLWGATRLSLVWLWGRNTGADNVRVHVSPCLPGVTAVCQGLCSLLQMAQPLAPRVPRLSALIDRGRSSHGLGACRLIARLWPLGPLGPLRGSGVAQPWQPRQ